MQKSLFFKFFPIPDYLEMPAVGLDISDQTIKLAQFSDTESGLRLTKRGEVEVLPGIIESGEVKKETELKEIIGKLKTEHKFENVIVGLPEERSYIITLKIPFVPEEEIRDAIELQLEEHIPLSANDVVFDYEILSKPQNESGSYELSVAVFPQAELLKYHTALTSNGLRPLAYEIESHSLTRALIGQDDDHSYMIVDVGKTRTGITIVERGVVTFTSTLSTVSGDSIGKLIEKNLNVAGDVAEKAKAEKGLMRSASNRGVFESLLPLISTLRDEISRYYLYWRNREGETPLKLSKIIFCGGQSVMPGLIQYIGANLDVPCESGNPWVNVYDSEKDVPPIDHDNSLRYSTAIGLALRNIL